MTKIEEKQKQEDKLISELLETISKEDFKKLIQIIKLESEINIMKIRELLKN
jgi:hypothetical protein